MCPTLKKISVANVFPALCYLLAIYFFFAFSALVGVPPSKPLDHGSATYLLLALFLFMLPEAKRIRLGKLFEFEARVNEIKDDVKQFKEETRNTLSAYTTLVSAISNTVSQTINVHLPGREEAAQAKAALKTTLRSEAESPNLEEQIQRFIEAEDNDLNYALAKLRMQLEKELRRILEKRTEITDPIQANTRFLSTRSLFSEFIRTHPEYQGIGASFDYVLKVCNAAIHGQIVPTGYMHDALDMGFRMLAELKAVQPNERPGR